ncbi:protein of unknown function DUF29 [Gloeothece citriformis PCC 7424]|uniref:DUF29 domain-containing protein n=1 Tax=Gloeothece citriformis (strain PCC 7424) TaxID=65393 RepID=B7K987_GLOC7|nr:DUF29 domain-containing protein [Gloeothece citriformis]ACK68570.1 protein of unknown function DUF29 [Gloeothece citriformis PCC 7424]
MTIQLKQEIDKVYEEDYLLWLEQTAEQLRQKDIENLDWEHLIDEIEDLGKAQKNAVETYLRQLLKHLLLYQYWTQEKDYCADGWAEEIDNFRNELEILLRSKTLYNYSASILEATYQKARRSAFKKTKLDIFPSECPYTLEQVLDLDYLPE